MTRRPLGIVAWGVLGICAGLSRGEDPRLADQFGFQPLEIYKLGDRINVLVIADLDGDRTDDIVVANNARSRIDLLLSSPGPTEDPTTGREVNQVAYSRRMRLKSLPVNREVASIVAGDLDGNGRVDLAYYGTPAEVVVVRGLGNGEFVEHRKINAGEGVSAPTALAITDVNRDGRDDLVLLGPNELITMTQRADGRLGDPERFPHTAARPGIFKALDLDGDGGDDLILLDSGNDDPIRVRFSTETGSLGPEERFAVEPPRAIAFADLDGVPGQELLMVEGQSGRVRVLKLAEPDSEDVKRGRLLFYPLPVGEARNRALAIGDLDGDAKADVVVTDPSNAQLMLYLQGGHGLRPGRSFPNLAGVRGVTIADVDGDGVGEVLVLSEQEKTIGMARYRDGRLGFPSPLPIEGEPVALEAGDLDGDKQPEVLYVARAVGGSSADGFVLRAVRRGETGGFEPFRWGETDMVAIPGLSGIPPAVRILDINRDQRADVLVFRPFGAPILMLGQGDGKPPKAMVGNLGPLVAATPAGISLSAPGEASLLVTQSGFARAIVLGADGQWQVKDQFNAGRGSAQIAGAATVDLDGDGSAEVVLYDRSSKSLLFLDQRDRAYRPGGTLSIGAIDFQGMHVADLDGDGRDDLLIAGTDRFGVVTTGRRGRVFRSLASYDTNRKDAILGDVMAGDVNGDGRIDLIVSDIGDNALEILDYDPQEGLRRALAFKIFEKKSFRDRDSLIEPRDMAVGDVDGDGRTDIILICHDRVLVYRQDPGEEAHAEVRAE
ncbi:MAG: hypothetical protein KatS3mg108_0892 [Isosphaeraceae bacterium]|jgi:hypothetical protein|nr:MAG: hypothetical protein KatS3mg108_0892 [Isosphaeraceae bacterium]